MDVIPVLDSIVRPLKSEWIIQIVTLEGLIRKRLMSNIEKIKSARQRTQELGLCVFKICEELHGSNNGSCDRLDKAKEELYINLLELYIDEWVDYKQSILYDTAVKRLIEATITETKLNWSIYELVNYSNNRKRIKQVETPQI